MAAGGAFLPQIQDWMVGFENFSSSLRIKLKICITERTANLSASLFFCYEGPSRLQHQKVIFVWLRALSASAMKNTAGTERNENDTGTDMGLAEYDESCHLIVSN